MSVVNDAADEFNSSIKFLARVYALKKKNTFEEEKALRNNKRLAMVISADPLWMIEYCGPYFLKYADIIKAGNWDALIGLSFTEEKGIYGATPDGSKHSGGAMDGKIKFIKHVFMSANAKERGRMGSALQCMLSAYCKYAIYVKNK